MPRQELKKIKTDNLREKKLFSKSRLLIFVIAFAAIGGYLLLSSYAAPLPSPANEGLTNGASGSQTTDLDQLSKLLSNYGKVGGQLPGDINNDGTVNALDLSILLSHYGK